MNFIKLYINKFENENIIIGGNNLFYLDPELEKQTNIDILSYKHSSTK